MPLIPFRSLTQFLASAINTPKPHFFFKVEDKKAERTTPGAPALTRVCLLPIKDDAQKLHFQEVACSST